MVIRLPLPSASGLAFPARSNGNQWRQWQERATRAQRRVAAIFRQLNEKAYDKPDGCPPPPRFSENTLREWSRRQQEIPKGSCVDERNVEPGEKKRTARPTASRKNTMTSTSRGRQGQKPHGKNPRPEFKETVRYCEMCRSTIMQESASGAMSSMCEDCSWTQRMALVFSSVLHALYHPPLPPPPPGLDAPPNWY